MRIDGEWFECDDGLTRPIIRGEILSAGQNWEPTLFLVDTGADRTVFSAALLDVLGFESLEKSRLGGVGGIAESVEITQIRLSCDHGGWASFRGQYAAFTQLESLDVCVLGRDIMQMFAVIVDRPADIVALIRPPHQYVIQSPLTAAPR
jgi:hypothetical protein